MGASRVPEGRTLPFRSEEYRLGSDLRVVVVGAGLAGLTAALELSSAGATVHVLEASTRTGGAGRRGSRAHCWHYFFPLRTCFISIRGASLF